MKVDNHIVQEFIRIVGKDRVVTRDLDLIALAADAGCYKKTPQVIVKPGTEAEVSALLQCCYRNKVAVSFRAAGTSLSGQAVSDSVLLLAAGDTWSRTEILEGGKAIRTQPGITGNRLNILLKPYGRQFGPDPASVNSAMVGGIIANNASGMSCGIHANSYATIRSARLVFPDGTVLDTSDENSRNAFKISHEELLEKIAGIREEIRSDKERENFIRRKYEIKNTCGYGLNSFLDYTDPIDILLHLIVGSEGTLAFVSEAVFETVPLKSERASSMIYFKTLKDACDAVYLLKEAGVSAIELMDREALRSVENKPGMPAYLKDFGPEVSALLIDLLAESDRELGELMERAMKALGSLDLEREFTVSRKQQEILELWKVRKGVFPSVGGMRKPGTAVIIEDIAVRLEYLSAAVQDIRSMLDQLGYKDAVIYGHALDGNLHFIFSQDFTKPEEIAQYRNLIETLVRLIVDKYQGSLKAEHGTGINMAPFVKYEWGTALYGHMVALKNAFDPYGILNPGVLINDDPEIYLKNFKQLPEIDPLVDKCIECGFCEVHCVSAGLTLSARQRIVVQRELSLLDGSVAGSKIAKRVRKAFVYEGEISCAGDGLCSTGCPLDIDTGVYVKKLREEKVGYRKSGQKRKQVFARLFAKKFSFLKEVLRLGLGLVNLFRRILGTGLFGRITAFLHRISFRKIPRWTKHMPVGAAKFRAVSSRPAKSKKVVYFPSCISQVMAPSGLNPEKRSLTEVTVQVLERAGYEVVFPENYGNMCCGTPWESKGYHDLADAKSTELEKALLKASNNGEYPVLCDTSPCIYRMRRVMDPRLKMFEPVEFAHDYLVNTLKLNKISGSYAFHITCSSTKMGLGEKFRAVAACCVEEPVFPDEVGCCGFAGDKGFTLPALNAWGLRKLKLDLNTVKKGYSNSRTCEIGLSEKSGIHYESVMYLLEKVSS
ncbi:MAG: FAD-binding and (Fe-S)-binding domain-containing protein [Bacteroidota bacterium]